MTILHISNDFAGSKVHSNLAKCLDKRHLNQIVYCPLRNPGKEGTNSFNGQNISFIYNHIIKPWYRYVYHYKQRKLYDDVRSKVDLPNTTLIHAATLFSDGGLAYRAHVEYGIPYVVAVRSTDIYAFAKLQIHTWGIGRRILLNAKKIYFISQALFDEFATLRFVKPILSKIIDKCVVRPNGIDQFWLDNINTAPPSNNHKIIYVGDFSKRKNVCRLIDAIKQVRNIPKYQNITLTVVGGGNDYNNHTINTIKQNSNFVDYVGKISNKDELLRLMRQHSLFAMPSIHETFGLVYIEAISQNLPAIHTKGEGIDGLFLGKNAQVSIGTNALSVESIKNSIIHILDHRELYTNTNVDFSIFNWDLIAEKYHKDYISVVDTVK